LHDRKLLHLHFFGDEKKHICIWFQGFGNLQRGDARDGFLPNDFVV